MSIKLRIINVSDSFQNFTLRDALALPLHPSNPIEDRSMIYTVVSDKTPSLADSEIQFRGFGWSDNRNDDTLEDLFPVGTKRTILKTCTGKWGYKFYGKG